MTPGALLRFWKWANKMTNYQPSQFVHQHWYALPGLIWSVPLESNLAGCPVVTIWMVIVLLDASQERLIWLGRSCRTLAAGTPSTVFPSKIFFVCSKSWEATWVRTCSKETSDMSVDCEDMARPPASYKPYVVPILSSITCCFSCIIGVSISIHCSPCPSIVIDGTIQLLGDFPIRLQGLRPSDLCVCTDLRHQRTVATCKRHLWHQNRNAIGVTYFPILNMHIDWRDAASEFAFPDQLSNSLLHNVPSTLNSQIIWSHSVCLLDEPQRNSQPNRSASWKSWIWAFISTCPYASMSVKFVAALQF